MSSLAAASVSETSTLLGITPIVPGEISLSIEKNVFEYDGKWYGIYKNCDNMNNEVIERISPLFELNNPNNVLQPGVYTWMITADKSNTPHLYVKKTLFLQEIQTKHGNIVYDLQKTNNADNIYYAGELQATEEPKKLRFNYLSGSYMLGRNLTEEQEGAVFEFFKSKFPQYEVKYDKITPGEEETYITADTFEMDKEKFTLLKQVCPGNIYMFDNKSEANVFVDFERNNGKLAAQIRIKENALNGRFAPEPGSEMESKVKAEIAGLKGQIKTLAGYEGNKLTSGGIKRYSKRKKQRRLRKKTSKQKK